MSGCKICTEVKITRFTALVNSIRLELLASPQNPGAPKWQPSALHSKPLLPQLSAEIAENITAVVESLHLNTKNVNSP